MVATIPTGWPTGAGLAAWPTLPAGGPEATLRAVAVAVLTFVLVVLLTRPLISWLKARGLGKAIRVDGPNHAAKAGTPTMGGLAMLAVLGLVGTWQYVGAGQSRPPIEIPITVVAMAAFAFLGLLDDLAGLAQRSRGRELGVGLGARQMLVLQLLAAAAVSWWLASARGDLKPSVLPPLAAEPGVWSGAETLAHAPVPPLWVSVLAIVGTANGTNMSDGLDGLAAGLAALAYGGLASILVLVSGWTPAAVFALAIAAACLGFLVYNRHPARVMMGNVTSLPLGAGLATLALASGTWPLLPLIGAVFAAEVVSVIIQVGYFKWTGGRRVFRMAPLHHHFELGGWSEVQVVHRFWLAGLIAALAGVLLAGATLLPLATLWWLFAPATPWGGGECWSRPPPG